MRVKESVGLGTRIFVAVFLLLFIIPVFEVYPQSSDKSPEYKRVKLLLDNVVRINVSSDGGTKAGFGFIVGERKNGDLLIATCNHLVRNDVGEKAEKITVMFRGSGKWINAGLLEGHLKRPQDLAVLEVQRSQKVPYVKDWISLNYNSDLLRGLQARFVGRENQWWVSAKNLTINRYRRTDSIIEIETNLVKPGTSGAPLIITDGIIGMIVSDSGSGIAKALSIKRIREAFLEWGYQWEDGPVVYITRRGKKYHTEDCHHGIIPVSLREAHRRGFTSCLICNPPTLGNSQHNQHNKKIPVGTDDDPIVYKTRNGECYHKGDCSSLKYSKSSIKLSKAVDKKLKPCKKCKPPIFNKKKK